MYPEWIRSMPKVELHRHLEGSIRPATILDMFRRNLGMYLDTSLEELLPRMQITGSERSLVDFLAKFEFFMPCIKSRADITRITREVIEDCAAEGTVHAELRFSPAFIRASPGCCGGGGGGADGAREVPAGMSVSFILGTPQPRGWRWRDTVKLAATTSPQA